MIPLSLQIKNFLSYGPESQQIDFTNYHMICLSGKNGHGKSALLDAITWAVWGQARKTSGQPKPDNGLLHLGERNMRVVFDFEFNHKRYRVRREFTFAYGKPTAYLEFGMFVDYQDNKENNELISLTDKTIRKTQAKIELLLGLDFDSFINSAFIRQGNAGEFSQKTPKERKEILGNILGLNVYDKLRKAASERAKLLENERQALLKLHERLLQELQQDSQVEVVAQDLQIKLLAIKEQQISFEQKLKACQQAIQKIEISRQLNLENKHKLVNLQLVYAQDLEKLKQLKLTWQQLLDKLIGKLNRQDLENKKNYLVTQVNNLRIKQKLNWQLHQELSQHKSIYEKLELELLNTHDQKINVCKFELEKLQNVFSHQAHIYQKQTQELNVLIKNQELFKHQIQACLSIQDEHDQLQKKFERYKDFYQRLIVMGNSAKHLQDDLIHKQVYLEQDCPACPLCAQSLSNLHKQDLKIQFTQQVNFAQHRVVRVAKVLKNLKNKILEQHAHLEKLKEKLQEFKILQVQLVQDKSKLLELEQLVLSTTPELDKTQQAIDLQAINLQNLINMRAYLLQNHDQVILLTKTIKHCENNLQANSYQEADLQKFELELEQVNLLLDSHNHENLHEQRVLILEQISTLVRELKIKKYLQDDLAKQLQQDEKLSLEKTNLEQQFTQVSQAVVALKTQHDTILQQLGSVHEQIKKIAQIKQELEKLKIEILRLELANQDYKLLVTAFGKDGIQALLIEDAIPEIEQEANYLLGRLTDNQAQLFIESLRDLKSGGTKETLDIKISDNVGLRPYEMFSGGEAFRIDFALRIAISKLLAKRAGTALQTLIIDEGFGSQDEEGLAHIMDALYKIQDDFAKIIIVSHLSSMKEQFPVHFCINKTLTGSTVTVIEQG